MNPHCPDIKRRNKKIKKSSYKENLAEKLINFRWNSRLWTNNFQKTKQNCTQNNRHRFERGPNGNPQTLINEVPTDESDPREISVGAVVQAVITVILEGQTEQKAAKENLIPRKLRPLEDETPSGWNQWLIGLPAIACSQTNHANGYLSMRRREKEILKLWLDWKEMGWVEWKFYYLREKLSQ